VAVRFKYVVSQQGIFESDAESSGTIAVTNQLVTQLDPYAISNYHRHFEPNFQINFPEDAIICSWSMELYAAAHQALFMMNITHQALKDSWTALKVSMVNDGANDLGHTTGMNMKRNALAEMRRLHILRADAQFVVRALQEHTSNALFEAWAVFETAAEGVEHVLELRKAHEVYVTEVARACFVVDERSKSYAQAALQSCLSIAQVITNASNLEDTRREKMLEQANELRSRLEEAVRCLRESQDKEAPLWFTLGAFAVSSKRKV
jgi:hypothetical protein